MGHCERARSGPRRTLVGRGDVALVTRTIRRIDTEVELGPDNGMPVLCAVSLDNLRAVPKALLTESITRLSPERMDAICRALTRATGC